MRAANIAILSAVVALSAFLALPSSPAYGATLTVTTTADTADGVCDAQCSLREAITVANASGNADRIAFDAGVFPSGAPGTITIASELPALTGGGDTIDGINRGVIVDGPETRDFNCITIESSDNTIKGLQVTDCASAILVSSGTGNTIGPDNTVYDSLTGVLLGINPSQSVIVGNKIGTTPDGTAEHGDGGNNEGVKTFGPQNLVGGTNLGDGNVISGNSVNLAMLTNGDDNLVQGNFIGTDVTGTVDLGSSAGVVINADDNTIGGSGPGEGNLISGNSTNNLRLLDGASGNTIAGNIIGPDVNGSGAAMTNGDGVQIISGSAGNTVGPGNIISDNSNGVAITDAGSDGNVVKGNFIGTDINGANPVPNSGNGVAISGSAKFNMVGGSTPGDGNVIAFSGNDGVQVDGSGTTNNSLRGNSIHSSVGPEINNLNGGNLELAPPTLTSSDGVSVSGTACPYCEIDIFSDAAGAPRIYEGSTTAGVGGNWSFAVGSGLQGPNLVATQTDIFGNTSEVSASIPVIDNDGDGVGDAADPDDDNDGLPDTNDLCPQDAEDFDGFEDADGCPDTDNDLDGIADASDSGEMCFDPAGTLSCPTTDCSNVAEDIDGFKDSDGCPEPDNDNDGFPDGTDDCPGTDAHAGGDGMLGSPEDLDHNGVQNGAESSLTTDDSVLVFEDYDGVLDGDGCHDSPGDDFDGDGLIDDDEVFVWGTEPFNPDTDADGVLDGADNCPALANPGQALPPWAVPVGDADCDAWTTADEIAIGTAPDDACGASAWPPDFNDDQSVDIFDINFLRVPVFFSEAPGPPYDVRLDLNPDGIIDIFDVNRMRAPIFFASCTP